ncbi:leucine--tRNA ligase [Rickettsiales bacterium]|nr:leucine--tRNA ligase [Rickettsiales bacterium]
MVQSFRPYNFMESEEKWQKRWESEKAYRFEYDPNAKNFYTLEMLPYPSGKLHLGHIRNYTAGDVVARYRRMNGYNVLHPIGWDAFGLPAENAAIEQKASPLEWTKSNIENMKVQLKGLGLSYDWDREIATCDEDYYRHEQYMFLQMYKNGMAYYKDSLVNWDPVDQTVLANEQVINGKGWRSGADVEQKKLKQWFLKTSMFAEDLNKELDNLDGWPSKVKSMQSKWIGRSEGANIDFKTVENNDSSEIPEHLKTIEVFTTRPDTIFGASFVCISTKHPLAKHLMKRDEKIAMFNERHKNEKDDFSAKKEGIFTGLYVDHIFNNKAVNGVEIGKLGKLPVYIANFILHEYGSGAIFGCPAHDERDNEFAKLYNLPIRSVVRSESETKDGNDDVFSDDGIACNSFFLDGMRTNEAKKAAINAIHDLGHGTRKVQYKLKDWGISRQRYWGCPIPMIHCPKCGIVPEKEENLPIVLPTDVVIDGRGNPLKHSDSFKSCVCNQCGEKAQRETDTFDTFFESSWYFLRYLSPDLKTLPFDKEVANNMMPVDEYIGGIEHAILHLMYARFFVKALNKIGLIDKVEPFKRLTTQGMVCHRAYRDAMGRWLEPDEVVKKPNGKYALRSDDSEVEDMGVIKMSKSKKNIINVQDIIENYGADNIRLAILADNPLEQNMEWNNSALMATSKYMNRVWKLVLKLNPKDKEFVDKIDRKYVDNDPKIKKAFAEINKTIKDYSSTIENFQFNKSIAYAHTMLKIIESIDVEDRKNGPFVTYAISTLLLLLSPMIPHFANEAMNVIAGKGIENMQWPKYDNDAISDQEIGIGVQVNGKARGSILMNSSASKEEYIQKALENAKIRQYIGEGEPKKIIVVPKKIINFIV